MHTVNIKKEWLPHVVVFFVIIATIIGITFSRIRTVIGAQVPIDTTVFSTTAASHSNTNPTLVFISDQTGYAFYRDSTGSCVYSKTTNGGTSWGTAVTVDSQTDCLRINVWYDRWTPGDTTGTYIHIATIDSGSDDIWYRKLNTATDAFSPPGAMTDIIRAGSYTTTNFHSITKAINGDLYMGVSDANGDSFVIRCASSSDCTVAGNWTAAGSTNPLVGVDDPFVFAPLPGGDILLIRQVLASDQMQSLVYHVGTNSWDASWTTIDTNAVDNGTKRALFGAVVKTSGSVFLAYITDVGTLGGGDDDIRTKKYDPSLGSWTTTTDVLTNDARSVTDVSVAYQQSTDEIYVVYSAGATNGTENIYWKKSSDGMTSWSQEKALITTNNQDIYGVSTNYSSADIFYAVWTDAVLDDLFGSSITDVTQTHYHWRNDNGSEVGATSATGGSQDIPLASLGKGITKRLRVAVSNEGPTISNAAYRLEYSTSANCVSGTWTDVGTAGGDWDMSDSTNLTDGANTTDISIASGGTANENPIFKTPNGGVKDTASQTASIQLSPVQFVELEYSIKALSSAIDGATYRFRVTNAGTSLDTYSACPAVTISSNNPPNTPALQETPTFPNEQTPDTTPVLGNFSTTDPEGDTIEYQVQIDDNADFSSPLTLTDNGLTSINSYTMQDALANGQTYWWRVRARDPLGSNTWSSYSTPSRSISIDTSLPLEQWFQTTGDQFNTGTLNDAAVTAGEVKVQGW